MATIPSSLTTPIKTGVADFKPWYTPQEMLQLGVYGGIYFYYLAFREGLPDNYFAGIDKAKYESPEYTAATNYYNVVALIRNRELQNVPSTVKRLHPAGWFQWYTLWSLGLEDNTYVNAVRIKQWKSEILTFSFYIEQGTYTPPDPNPNSYNRYTDPSFKADWKQQMLQFGWDPTRKPADYGIYP